jgi:iron complex outermembrane receptor protein
MKPPRPPPRPLAAAALLAAGAAASAQTAAPPSLADLTLEQLSSIEVTSVGKRVQRLADVPGSVYVISQEEIRRSGAVTLAEALRLAPNLQVARADANQYAITARGFNSVLANKMLVLVDGRTVYSPLFSGVFWEVQDMLLDDIERIEVLSGAGGTLYGSNAVNGVINIISRNAAETAGALVKAGAGNQEKLVGARWGAASAGGTHWRVYAKRFTNDNTELASGAAVRDASRRTQAGFRADRAREHDQYTLQGDIYRMSADQAPSPRDLRGANLLARWTRDAGAGVRSQLQAYFDRTERDQPGIVNHRLDTFDIEFQQSHRLGATAGHDLLWGAGYRIQDDDTVNLAPQTLRFEPPGRRMQLWNLFAQDELALAGDLKLTLGLKAEHNTFTGLEWLPTARLAWQAGPNALLWAAASRAVRTPSRVDRDVTTPILNLGGAGFDSEVAKVFEVGYRSQPLAALSYAFTVFHHDFERLRSVDLRAGGVAFGNGYHGRLNGLEAWGHWQFHSAWRLKAGYVHQRLKLGADSGSTALPSSAAQLGNDPRSRGQLALSWDVAPNMELDLIGRYMGALPDPAIPSYTALDFRWGWRVRPELELSLAVRNLTDAGHPEWGAAASRADIARSVFVKAVWRR